MSDELDPPSRELESLYESLRSDALGDAELGRIAANLGPLMDPPAGASGGGSGFSAKLFLMPGAVLGVATLAMLSLVVSESRPRAHEEASERSVPSATVEEPVRVADRAPELPTAEPALEPAPTEPSEPVDRATPRIEPAFDEGAELLRRARTALTTDPSRTLALTEQHRARFPRGMLTLERELLAIDALVAIGRRDEAQARGRRLLEADPDNGRVTRRLEQNGLTVEDTPP
jgi:hypothetical protein